MNIVIIGAGMMGRIHAEAYREVKDARVVAIVDCSEESGKNFAADFGCDYYSDIENIKAALPDFIDICLPTHLHVETIRTAARFCRNILCEKPVCIDLEEAKRLKEWSDREGINLMVAHVVRFMGGYVKARQLVNDGVIGAINSVVCTRRQRPPSWSGNKWFFDTTKSGGLSFDLMIHDIDYITAFLGEPDYIHANLSSGTDGEERHLKASLTYRNCEVSLFASWGMPENYDNFFAFSSLEIIGEKGMIAHDSTGKFVCLHDGIAETPDIDTTDPYTAELVYFTSCVMKEIRPEICNIGSAILPLTVADSITRAAAKDASQSIHHERNVRDHAE